MRKTYFLTLLFSAFLFSAQAQVEIVENFDDYDLGEISPQSDNWRTWSGTMGGPEDALVNDDEANSPAQSLYIDDSEVMDAIFLVPGPPVDGIYTLQMYVYIPQGKSGYFNMQAALTPEGVPWNQALMGGNVYFNCDGSMGGQGGVTGVTDCSVFDAVFSYPEAQWFKMTCIYDLDAQTWSMNINDVEQFSDYPFDFGTQEFESLAGLDFYSASANVEMYIDDLIGGPGILSTENFTEDVFTVYPNPVTDILNIETQAPVDKIVVFDVLGKVVLQESPGTVSPSISMGALPSGTYFVKVFIDDNSKIVKILK